MTKKVERRVYFAQPPDGGAIKIGCTENIEVRERSLNISAYGGMEILVSIPGWRAREHFLMAALRPWKASWGREWVRSCPAVWRVILEAIEKGDLPWVAPDLPKWGHQRFYEIRNPAIIAAGEDPKSCGGGGEGTYGRCAFIVAHRDRSLPAWLLAAHDNRTVLQ